MSVEKVELELAHRDAPGQAVHPLTGEAIDLASAPDEHLARFLEDVREYESRLREAKGIVGREVLDRLDKAALWTMRVGQYVLRAPSPTPIMEYDGPALREALLCLVDRGIISIPAVDAACETVVSVKVHKSGVAALQKLGGPVSEIIAEHARPSDKPRYVSVSRPTS